MQPLLLSFFFCRPLPASCLPVVLEMRLGNNWQPVSVRVSGLQKDLGYKKENLLFFDSCVGRGQPEQQNVTLSRRLCDSKTSRRSSSSRCGLPQFTKRLRDDRHKGLTDLKNDHEGGLIDTPEWVEDKKAIGQAIGLAHGRG